MPTATRIEMTQDTINELIAKRVKESLKVHDAAKNPITKTEIENEKQDDNVDANGDNGNDNRNENGNPNVNNGVGVDDACAMAWNAFMNLMTKRFQELTLLCTKMVPEEGDQVEKYIGGLPDNIQGNKLKGYVIKNDSNKRRFDNNPRDNRGQQQPFKRQNVNGQNVARAYTAGNNVGRRGYVEALPYYNKCILHHEGPCMVKCGNFKRVGHMTRDGRIAVAAAPQRAPVGNQMGNSFHVI
uniref:Reverse transcriptase domain-containing protein n=1 Tax=Tanacetum cinerariifolium TaxID=118510 RepID=A0A6L2JZW9_TANCI|nr:hypothetical protein [Tanacetum cinerariifolium]